MNKLQTVTLARIVTDLVHDGEAFRADLGHRPGLIPVQRAEALVWISEGGPEDVEKARIHAENCGEGWKVFTFPATETDPLGAAKRAVEKS